MASVEITITSLLDLVPFFKKTKLRKVILITSICVCYFLLGLPYTLSSGTYWVFCFICCCFKLKNCEYKIITFRLKLWTAIQVSYHISIPKQIYLSY